MCSSVWSVKETNWTIIFVQKQQFLLLFYISTHTVTASCLTSGSHHCCIVFVQQESKCLRLKEKSMFIIMRHFKWCLEWLTNLRRPARFRDIFRTSACPVRSIFLCLTFSAGGCFLSLCPSVVTSVEQTTYWPIKMYTHYCDVRVCVCVRVWRKRCARERERKNNLYPLCMQ